MTRAWIAVVVVVAVVMVGYATYTTRVAQPAGSVIAVSAKRADIESTVLASGVIEPRVLVSVGAQVSGRLLSLGVDLGERVKKGQLIGEIDSVPQNNVVRKYEAALSALRAQRDRALATLEQTRLTFRRQNEILTGKAGTRQDYETAKADTMRAAADLANLDAQIEGAAVDVDIAKTDLGYTKITAPIDGTVVAVVTKQGQTVISSQIAPTIVKLADLRTITVKANISEADVTRLKPGQPLHFTILAQPERRYDATLRAIEPAPDQIQAPDGASAGGSASSGSSTAAIYYNGRFEADNADGVLRPFMTAQIVFVLARAKQVVTIPEAALRSASGHEAHVQIQGADDRTRDRIVHTGVSNGEDVEIVDGLAVGDSVVIAGPGDVAGAKP